MSNPFSGSQHEHDVRDLAEFGYRQELPRGFSFWNTWAVAFALISPIVGLYTLVALGIETAGPAWWWCIPIVVVGQLLIALVYAQLGGRWPIAGGVYQWARHSIGPKFGWWTGWIYIWALVFVFAGVAFAGGSFLGDLLGVNTSPTLNGILLALVVVAIATLINAVGQGLLKYVIMFGIACELTGTLVVSIGLLLLYRHNGWSTLTDTSLLPAGTTFGAGFVAALAFCGWAILGFDVAGTVAEETRNPKRAVPRAIVWSLIPVGIVEIVGAIALMLAIPNLHAAVNGQIPDPIAAAVTAGIGSWATKPFLAIVVVGFTSCAIATQTAATRVIYSFSRDEMLPFNHTWSRVSGRNHLPVNAVLLVAAVSCLAFLYANGLTVLVTFATGAYFMAFICPLIGALYNRWKGRWRDPDYFFPSFLQPFGLVITLAALAWTGFEVVNIAWPRATTLPWYDQWAVILGAAAFGIVGLAYFLAARPDQRFSLQSTVLHGVAASDNSHAVEGELADPTRSEGAV